MKFKMAQICATFMFYYRTQTDTNSGHHLHRCCAVTIFMPWFCETEYEWWKWMTKIILNRKPNDFSEVNFILYLKFESEINLLQFFSWNSNKIPPMNTWQSLVLARWSFQNSFVSMFQDSNRIHSSRLLENLDYLNRVWRNNGK